MISKGCDCTCNLWLQLLSIGLVSKNKDKSGVPAVAAFLDDRRVGAARWLARPVTSNKLSSAVILRKAKADKNMIHWNKYNVTFTLDARILNT